ncbi:MAG: hypothetical protein B6229_01660 [Spirochaetaceae bacterium 4572_7]|nr:MAG: hypothetical protein B6229_01660 [Spirochaetaceae bacterium 4572_7]
MFDRDYIISWRDDYIEFYLPFNTAGRYVVLSSPKGNSNKYKIPVINKNLVTYSYENPMSYNLKQSVVLDNIVALKGSYINLFMPAVYRGLNQQSIKINSNNGVYNSDSNTVDIIIPIKDSGVSITTNLTSSLIVYNLKSVINKSSVVYRYDKKFPEYIRGFKDSPDVNSLDNDLYQTAKWLVRNSRNRYDQAQIIIEWINKYVKLNPTGSDVSEEIFKKREGSGIGLVNLAVSMIRSIGIPAIVVKGVKTSDTTNVYQWLEFYLVGGVWVPVDMLELYSNSSYEIGNINNNCIAFSKGVTMIKYQSENYRQDLYALQNCVDSFDGNIESYRAVWHNVIIE